MWKNQSRHLFPKRQEELDDWRDMGGEVDDEGDADGAGEGSLRSLSMERFSGVEAREK